MKKQIRTCLIVFLAITFTICLTMFAACVGFENSSVQQNDSLSTVITDNSSDSSLEDSSIEDSSLEDSSIEDSSLEDSSIEDSSIGGNPDSSSNTDSSSGGTQDSSTLPDSSSVNDSSSGGDSSSDDPACEHDWQDATCTAPKTCLKCGETIGDSNGHTAGEWVTDYQPSCSAQGSKHKECTVCKAVVETATISAKGHNYIQSEYVAATCETDGYIIYTCANNCEATKRQTLVSSGHNFNANNVCIKCGYKPVNHTHSYTTTTVEAGCLTIGYTQYTCSCGYSYKADYMPERGHRFNDGTVTKQATCTVNGEIKYSCERCSASYTAVLLAAHDFTQTVITAATCTTDGLIEQTCKNCQEKQTQVVKAAHSFNQGSVLTNATCLSGEVKQVTCTVCGHSEQTTGDALGHNFKNGKCTRCNATIPDVITPDTTQLQYGMYFKIDDIISNYGPDYINEYGVMLDYNSGATIKKVAVYLTQEGQMWRRAIACVGEGITYATYVPYLSYDNQIKYTGLNSDWINTFSLSLNASGVWCYSDYATIGVNLEDNKGNLLLSLYDIGQAGALTRIFTDLDEMKAWLQQDLVCNHVSSDWIIDKAATCKEAGSKHKECTLCGKTIETQTIAKLSHTASDWIIDKAATCKELGSKHKECTVCGDTIESEVLPAKGHNYGEWQITSAADCENAGERKSTCTRCEKAITTTIPAIGHSYAEVKRLAATCTSSGYIKYECANSSCTAKREVTLPAGMHEWKVSERVESGCEKSGHITYVCSACSDKYTETIPAGSHNYVLVSEKQPTKLASGYKQYKCSECNKEYSVSLPMLKSGEGNVLLIQDRLPWNTDVNATMLKQLASSGYIGGWNVITSSQITTIDLYSYDLIYIANDQTTLTYNKIKAASSIITEFAEKGGAVIYGSCDHGWASGEITYELPGGAGKTNYYSNYNYIMDSLNPVVTAKLTGGTALTNSLLYSTYCSHTTFTNLPDGANIILIDGKGNPSLVEYDYGAGFVMLSGLTWEYTYVRNMVGSNSFAKSVYDDMIVYALSRVANKCEHALDNGCVFPASCGVQGYTLYTCAKCGRVFKCDIVPALNHNYGAWVSNGDGSHTKTCSFNSAHTLTESCSGGIATCTKQATCTLCGEKYGSTVNHSYTNYVYDNNATCEEDGTQTAQCDYGCGKTNTITKSGTAFGHDYCDWIIDEEATCEKAGAKHKDCQNDGCGNRIEQTISATGHNYVNGVCQNDGCGAKDPNYSDNGDRYTEKDGYIYFGSYPQTKVSDSTVISALNTASGSLPTASQFNGWTNYQYYISSSNSTAFMWYKDVVYGGEKYRGVYFTSYRPYWCESRSSTSDTYQDNNGYSTGTRYWFKYEPIKWRVLTKQSGKAFLLCDIAIDSQEYYDNYNSRTINGSTVYPNNYEYSNIRKWLNDNFYNTAFSSTQQALIQTTLVDNSARSTNPNNNATYWNSGKNNYACSNTNDKIFLLSEQEITNTAYGFNASVDAYDTARRFKSSDYAKSQGCWASTSSSYAGNCYFWLRSPHYNRSSYAGYVSDDGSAS